MFFKNVYKDVCRCFKLLCSFFLSCWWAIAIVRFLVKFFCITYYLSIFHFYPTLIFPRHGNKVLTCIIFRVGNLLISFLSESIVFCKKWANNEQMSDLLKKTSDSLLCSLVLCDLSESLTAAQLIWANERIPNPDYYSGCLMKTS